MRSGTATAGFVPDLKRSTSPRMLSGTSVESQRGDGTMRYETGTFELRDNDMMMRELSSAETDEVVGGLGTAQVVALTQSGAGSTLTSSNGAFLVATTNTSAVAAISGNFAATGANNTIAMSAIAIVS
jgi:hypothetical protein